MNRKGFTLIELLIVVVIIGILAAIAIPKFANTKAKAYVASMKSDLERGNGAGRVLRRLGAVRRRCYGHQQRCVRGEQAELLPHDREHGAGCRAGSRRCLERDVDQPQPPDAHRDLCGVRELGGGPEWYRGLGRRAGVQVSW